MAEVSREVSRCLGERLSRRMELLSRRCELLGESGDFIGLALHTRYRNADFLEHPVEALLEEAELVGFGGGRAHRQEPLLCFTHDAAGAANALDQRRGDAAQRHRNDDEDASLEIRDRVQTGPARRELPMEPTGEQVGERGDQHEKIADRLSLIERVWENGAEQCRYHAT